MGKICGKQNKPLPFLEGYPQHPSKRIHLSTQAARQQSNHHQNQRTCIPNNNPKEKKKKKKKKKNSTPLKNKQNNKNHSSTPKSTLSGNHPYSPHGTFILTTCTPSASKATRCRSAPSVCGPREEICPVAETTRCHGTSESGARYFRAVYIRRWGSGGGVVGDRKSMSRMFRHAHKKRKR